MRRELLVPKLGLTMTEGVLLEWLVQPGEAFKAEQPIFVIESEKAANEIVAEADGVLLEITEQAGATLPCGTVIGYWDDGQAGEAHDSAAKAVAEPAPVAAAASAATPVAAVSSVATPRPTATGGARIPVTPLARRLAAEQDIDLAAIVGSGPRGRIRARDVQAAAQQRAPGMAPEAATAGGLGGVLRAPTSLERTVAERLTNAKQQVPHFYLAVDVEVSAVVALRAQLNAAQSRKKFTLNHFVLAAVGQALRAMPEINRVWTDEGILTLDSTDVGMAVDTEKGLLVPVLRDVGNMTLGQIADRSAQLISQAREGRLAGADMRGGAITVSNAGMHDVSYMASIINPGQSMILGVGCIRELFRPDENGQPAIHREMGLVLSADHRVLDGVTGLKFLKQIAQNLSQPIGMLVT